MARYHSPEGWSSVNEPREASNEPRLLPLFRYYFFSYDGFAKLHVWVVICKVIGHPNRNQSINRVSFLGLFFYFCSKMVPPL